MDHLAYNGSNNKRMYRSEKYDSVIENQLISFDKQAMCTSGYSANPRHLYLLFCTCANAHANLL